MEINSLIDSLESALETFADDFEDMNTPMEQADFVIEILGMRITLECYSRIFPRLRDRLRDIDANLAIEDDYIAAGLGTTQWAKNTASQISGWDPLPWWLNPKKIEEINRRNSLQLDDWGER